jgi:hypothetical protein
MCDLRVADMPRRFGPAAGYSRDSTTFIAQVTFSAAANPALQNKGFLVLLLSKIVAKHFFSFTRLINQSLFQLRVTNPFQENSSQYLPSSQPRALAPSFCARV